MRIMLQTEDIRDVCQEKEDKYEQSQLPPKIRKNQLVDSIYKALFVVGSALLIFIAARNSITWHCQRFWGASGNFWQRQWDRTYGLFGKDDVMISIWGTLLVTTSVFWLANALLIILDLTGHPSFLLKYKIQRKTHPLPLPMLWKAVRVVVFNQVAIGIPFIIVTYQLMKMRGCDIDGELPTFQWVVFELLVFSLVEEICFYYCHRFLHCPLLYKYFHKWHHEWTSPIGITSIYAHPLEHVISNLMPPGLGPLLMGSHLATAWMWFSLALISTTVAHCGYHFPFLPSPEAHDFHHLKFSQNYGVLGVLDRLHGTDMLFRKSRAYQRDILLIGFTPVSQQFPDSPSKKSK